MTADAVRRPSVPSPRAVGRAVRREIVEMPRALKAVDRLPARPVRGRRRGSGPRAAAGLGGAGHEAELRVGDPDLGLRLLRDHHQRPVPGVLARDRLRGRDVPAAGEAARGSRPAVPGHGLRHHRPRPAVPGPDGLRGGPQPLAALADVVDGGLLRRLPVLPRRRGLEHLRRALGGPPVRLHPVVDDGRGGADDAGGGLRGPRRAPLLARRLHAAGDGLDGAAVRHGPPRDRLLLGRPAPAGRPRTRPHARDPGDSPAPLDRPRRCRARGRLADALRALRDHPGTLRRDARPS